MAEADYMQLLSLVHQALRDLSVVQVRNDHSRRKLIVHPLSVDPAAPATDRTSDATADLLDGLMIARERTGRAVAEIREIERILKNQTVDPTQP